MCSLPLSMEGIFFTRASTESSGPGRKDRYVPMEIRIVINKLSTTPVSFSQTRNLTSFVIDEEFAWSIPGRLMNLEASEEGCYADPHKMPQ